MTPEEWQSLKSCATLDNRHDHRIRTQVMRRKVNIKSSSTVLTYSYMRGASWNALEYAKKSIEGQFYNAMTSMAFSAFCIEAYLNHIGQEKITYWQTIERGLSPREKLEVLSNILGISVDYSKRPYQTFLEIFRFRDAIAHGKTERLSIETIERLSEQERPSIPQTRWQKLCTLETATRYFEDTEQIVKELHERAGYESNPFLTLGLGGWKLSPVDDEIA